MSTEASGCVPSLALTEVAASLDELLFAGQEASAFENDQNGIYLSSDRPVRRIGLALEATPDLVEQTASSKLDALFLHRPWNLTADQVSYLRDEGIGVLAYHLAFDERLTTGFNPCLADALGMDEPETLGEKAGRPIGMIGSLRASVNFTGFAEDLTRILDGLESTAPPRASDQLIERITVVGAMTDALVREAHTRGAGVYITGQWRKPASGAVRETGIGVICTGHRQMEEWGLRALAKLLAERWTLFEAIILPDPVKG